MVKLVDTPDLGSGTARCGGSNPLWRTNSLSHTLAFDWRYTLAENDLPKVVGATTLADIQVGFPLLDTRLLDSAAVLGASPRRARWTVMRPVVQPALLVAAGFTSLCYDGQYFFDTDHPVGPNESPASVSNHGGGAGTARVRQRAGRRRRSGRRRWRRWRRRRSCRR